MKIKYRGQEYDLNKDLDRSFLEYMAGMADGKPTLQEFLLRETGTDINPPASDGQISAFNRTYDINNEEDYADYSRRLRAKEKVRIAQLKKDIDERIRNSAEPQDAPELTEEIDMNAPLPEELSPQAERYYQLKDETIPEYGGRKSQLAEWANNFKGLAQQNYDNRVRRGDELVGQVERDFAQEQFAQFYKDDKMMALVEGKTPSASRTQVPDFDPSSMNQNIDVEDEEVIDPKLEAFGRMNTNPIESVGQ